MEHTDNAMYLVLYNLRSVYNVGSIFRTADGVGIQKIYLVGTTPAPTDRFGRKRNDLAKVALGAENSVAWEYQESIEYLLDQLRDNDISITALEQDECATFYQKFSPVFPLALVAGEETVGLPKEVMNKCEHVIEIPMRGNKESLNVSISIAVAVYSFLVA